MTGDSPRTSIIIAVKEDNPYLRECLAHCLRLTDPDFEILVVTDDPCELPFAKTRVIASGAHGPSVKRDLGARAARGRILAFLDDDTFPESGWLAAAIEALAPEDVGAVGGPAVTPPGDGDRERASGWVYAARLVGGPYVYRYWPRPARDVDDYPTCNLLIKRDALERAGGFDTCYWPGEDTVVCLKLTHGLGLRIRYDPRVLVYHHRRKLFGPHMRQVLSYATHRGYFVKKFPKTSLRLGYFAPTLFTAGVLFGWLPGLWWTGWFLVYGGALALYAAAVLATSLTVRPKRLAPWVAAGVVLTHLVYGVYFVRGLTARRLREEP